MKKLYMIFLLASFVGFAQNPGDLVITEIMNNPAAVSDTFGEYFEIYNITGAAIDIDGWTIKDDGSNLHVIDADAPDEGVGGVTIVQPGGYLVLGRSSVQSANGGAPVDYAYGEGGQTLGNSADEIVLLAPGDIEISRVNYDGGTNFPDLTGESMQLSPDAELSETANDDGSNWCPSTSSYGEGDLGTPGAANDACAAVCEASLGTSDAVCITVSPGETDDFYTATLDYSGAATGEEFVVTSTAGTVDLSEGNNPTNDASGTITVANIPEGTDVTITVDNTADGGLCSLTRDIVSPTCVPTGSVDLELQGIIDFDLASSDGKAIHVVATADISDLSEYGLGIANNGGGTDGQEYTFDAISVFSGDHILIVRNDTAMEGYLTTEGYNLFDLVLVDAGGSVSQNGDDAIELFKLGAVVETFGDINVDGSGQSWEYADSWAYKDTLGAMWPNGWSYGAPGCSTGATVFDSSCVYPFVESLSNEELSANEVSIYPNPVSNGKLNISTVNNSDVQVEVYNLLGKRVLSKNVTTGVMEVSQLNSGIYLLKMSQNDNTVTKKLIIK